MENIEHDQDGGIELPIGIEVGEFERLIRCVGLKRLLRQVRVGQFIVIGNYIWVDDDTDFALYAEMERLQGGRFKLDYGARRYSKSRGTTIDYWGAGGGQFKINKLDKSLWVLEFDAELRDFVRAFMKMCRFCAVVRQNVPQQHEWPIIADKFGDKI